MKSRFTYWLFSLLPARHPAAEPKKKASTKRRKARHSYPTSPSPESNNLRGRGDDASLRYTPAP
ncbi:MAG: hypothetical protein EOO11_06295 [Chitinophagaceae bacterium]|nr:MAG: hypothetical protein EOO11_06295 [Chitinophagaceae bacterium]